MYQNALLTKIAIRLKTYIDNVVQMRNESSNDFYQEKKIILMHRRSRFFDTIYYLYEKKSLQHVRVTKSKQDIVTKSTR